MKNLKKLGSIALALVMVMAMMIPAFADNTTNPTITIDNASMGVTYYAYKLFDAEVTDASTNAGIAYYYGDAKKVEDITDAAVKKMFDDGIFQMNSIGQISKGVDKSDADVTAAVAAWAASLSTSAAIASGTGEGGALTLTLGAGNYGYYAVTSNQNNAAVTVNSTNPTVHISDKTTVNIPEILNNAKTVTSTGATYGLGETVSYRLEIPTTNWVRSTSNGTTTEEFVYQYVLTDDATAGYLAINTANVSVKVKELDADDSTLRDLATGHNATITRNAETGVMTITVPWGDNETKTSYYNNRTVIVVTYTATVTGTGKGTNTLTADYNTTDMGGSSHVDVHNVALAIDKYDSVDNTKKLDGATFVLKNSADKYYKYVAATDTTAQTVTWVDTEAEASHFTTDTDGQLDQNFVGLADGTYTLVETAAPDGYNKMADKEIQVVGTDTNEFVDMKGVENSTGAVLPSTGGMGTTIFYAIGGILLAGSAILFVTKKRMGE